jgi:hypothetical protein
MTSMSEFSVWFRDQYFEWEKKNGTDIKGTTVFANWLGIPQPMVSNWIAGRYKPGAKYIPVLASKLGLDIYSYLGLEKPKNTMLYLPADLRESLEHAIAETNETLERKGLTGDSPDAEETVTEIWERWGFRRTEKIGRKAKK